MLNPDSTGGQKEKWETPQLLVLVRGRPEEVVLAACKGGGHPGGFITMYTSCSWRSDCGYQCLARHST